MNNKKRENKVHESFDVISKEMAEFVVNNKKNQIESEIEKDILHVEKKKRRRDKELRKTKKFLINKGDESSESEQLNYNKNNNLNLKRSNSKEDMRNFIPKKNSNANNDIIPNKNEKIYNKNDKENFSANISFKKNSKEKLDKNKKEEIEVTITPFFDNNEDEDDEINYYNIRDYIDNKERLEKKKLKSHKLDKIRKSNIFFNKKNPIKRGFTLNKANKIKGFSREKKEGIFFYEDQQNDDSDDWGNYLDDLTLKKDSDTALLYTNSKNNTFNKNLRDSSDYLDSDVVTTNQKNMFKNITMIFDYFQDKKLDKKDFLEKQLNRKRLTEIKINRKRERIKYLESKNNYYSPKIDELSLEIIRNKGNYVPLFKRAVELENEKKMKILIKQKIKNKNLSLNASKIKKRTKKQINEFYKTQMNWKDKVQKENNILKLKLREKENESEKNSEMNFTPRLSKSELTISRRKSRPKTSFALYDNNICKSTTYSIYLKENMKTNIGYKLYKDYETRQKKLNRLKKKLAPSFTPIINKSSSYASRNYNWMIKRRNLSKSIDKSSSLIFEYDSSFISKHQKSRNPKKVHKTKFNNNKNKSSQPFNIKDINNYLKSTAVDSRNSKSRSSIEIFGSKLEKINEYKDQDEEYSSSDYSLNNISNRNINSKLYKSNKNNKSISLEQNKKLNSGRVSNNIITNVSEEKNQSKVEDLTNKSISKEINSNKEETKSLIEHKESSKNIVKEYNTGKMNDNLKLDDIKEFLDIDHQNSNKASQTPTLGKNVSTKNNKEKKNLNIKSSLKKKSVEIKEVKQIKELKDDINIDIKQNKENNEDDKNNDKIEKDKINNSKKIVKISDNKNINNKSNGKIKEKIEIQNNHNSKSTKKLNPFTKLFSKGKIDNNPKKNNYIFDTKKSKSIFVPNKSSSSISNNNNELDDQPQEDNIFKNQYDSIETNNNLFNFEHKDSNYLNDFLTNKVSSNLSYKEENLIPNSSYNLDKEMIDSQNSLNINIPDQTKKTEKEIIKQYKIDDSEKEEIEEDEEEETETINDKNEKKEKSFSWISKLNEISRNEEMKSEMNIYNKKKTGGSTTRQQTKRQNENNNFNSNKNFLENLDENKLYMLNLRNSSSTGNINPYTIVAKDPMFYKFFLKKRKHNN